MCYFDVVVTAFRAISKLSVDFWTHLQRLKSLLVPNEHAFKEVEEKEGISQKKLLIK